MMENWNEFDYEALKAILPEDELVKIWSKLEIARIMSQHVKKLITEVKTDLEFNLAVHSLREE